MRALPTTCPALLMQNPISPIITNGAQVQQIRRRFVDTVENGVKSVIGTDGETNCLTGVVDAVGPTSLATRRAQFFHSTGSVVEHGAYHAIFRFRVTHD